MTDAIVGTRLVARWILAVLLVGAAAGAAPSSALAQTAKQTTKRVSKPAAPSLSSQLAAQKKLIEAQQATIDLQQALITQQKAVTDTQAVTIAAQQANLQKLETQLAEMKTRLDNLESQANLPAWESELEARLKQVEAASQKSPELPPDIVSAGDFPGSIRIPGSDAAIKFGGRIRTAVVFTLDPLGTDDRFLTNSIPVGVSTISGESKRTNISARASRLNIEFRTPSGAQEIRAFFEGDFAGTGNSFRLRHAYAQFHGFIVGQTWSTFSDPAVNVEDLDFEGISSENVIRQAQVRYWWTPKPNRRLAVAIETPAVSISGGTGVNLFPDLIARGFFGRENSTHTQIAFVLRQIRGEAVPGDIRSDWGAGGSVSGIMKVPAKALADRVLYQLNGGVGIARYINDLSSAGGMDAAFDSTTGNLHALAAIGWYVAYEHRWKEWDSLEHVNLRSTLLWSRVAVDNYDFQPHDAYRKTNRVATNVVFSPSARADFGVEYIFGTRQNKDGQHARANQIQLVALFRF